jgi:predicted AAA+ superfamily ATPase
MRKVYFTNSSFQFAVHGLSCDNLGKVAENAVLQAVSPDNYYREDKDEIDFLITLDGKVVPIEVKYGSYEPDRIITLIKKLDLSHGIIVSGDEYRITEKNGVKIRIVPLWLFVLYPYRIEEIL